MSESRTLALIGRISAAIVAVVGAPLAVYAVILLVGISGDVAILKTKVETALTDPYKGADAKRDFDRRDDAIRVTANGLEEAKGRIKTLEDFTSRRSPGRPQP